MENYLNLLSQIMSSGFDRSDRTDVGSSRCMSGAMLKWDLAKHFPVITTRKVALRIAFEETMMFLRGETDTTTLEDKNITIWKGNTTREFLDAQGLHDLPVGSLGKGYSHQWRNFGGDIGKQNGVDQIADLLNGLKQNPTSRRHIVTAWNPAQLHETPLPPCHLMQMYTVNPGENKLNSCFIMRSTDVYHGLPYNAMGYGLLNCIFAKYLGYEPGELVYQGWDAHVYANQFDVVKEQLTRTPQTPPTLQINKELNTLDDIMSLEFDDIELVGYNPLPPLQKVNMAV